MNSVTGKIKETKQPRGGFVKPSLFERIQMENDGEILSSENINPSLSGTVVDYLTRFMSGESAENAFDISLKGIHIMSIIDQAGVAEAASLVEEIKGIDDNSIRAACKLAAYDVWYRNITAALISRGSAFPDPDACTINNIRIMVNRSLKFFEKYGPVVKSAFTFEEPGVKDVIEEIQRNGQCGGYTKEVSTGDGDILTKDTLWDFKVSKNKPNSKQTLQLLMYWIMGQHSGQEIFKDIKYIGIFNPRLNIVYRLCVDDIDKDVIRYIEECVIGY